MTINCGMKWLGLLASTGDNVEGLTSLQRPTIRKIKFTLVLLGNQTSTRLFILYWGDIPNYMYSYNTAINM